MGDRLRAREALWLSPIALLVSLGTFWAFERGGKDFDVFHHAWQLVLAGRGLDIYRDSPDRFLYAPGFAWLLAPIAWLPRGLALALWCFAKAAAVGLLARTLGGGVGDARSGRSAAAVALGFLLFARPLLIDFQYGQVNVLILATCAWGLVRHFSARARGGALVDGLAWGLVGVAAVAKIFPLPLLLVPFIVPGVPEAPGTSTALSRARARRLGVVLGAAVVLALPFFALGWTGGLALLDGWREALANKGLPLESHNQSFAAFLRHFFSDEATHVISWGSVHEKLGWLALAPETLASLTWGWALIVTGVLLGWLATGWRTRAPAEWIAVLLALLILPSHLVWKPYFVFGIPLAIVAIERARGRPVAQLVLALVFVAVNLTGFDFIGGRASGWLEAGSIFLWAYLALFGVAASAKGGPKPGRSASISSSGLVARG